MKYIKSFNESKSAQTKKDLWWNKNYKKLIKVASDIPYEDWEVIIKNKEDFDGVYNSTAKNRALYLLDTYSIKELEEMIDEYTFED